MTYLTEVLLGLISILLGAQIWLKLKKPSGLYYQQPKPVINVEVPAPVVNIDAPDRPELPAPGQFVAPEKPKGNFVEIHSEEVRLGDGKRQFSIIRDEVQGGEYILYEDQICPRVR